MKITVSVIKADVGGIGGHTRPSDNLIQAVRDTVSASSDLLIDHYIGCLLYTSPSPRDLSTSRMPSSA